MNMNLDADPRGLIREAYSIGDLTREECRSIFLDWALGVPDGVSATDLLPALLTHYEPDYPDHHMTTLIREGMVKIGRPRRRGRQSRTGRQN